MINFFSRINSLSQGRPESSSQADLNKAQEELFTLMYVERNFDGMLKMPKNISWKRRLFKKIRKKYSVYIQKADYQKHLQALMILHPESLLDALDDEVCRHFNLDSSFSYYEYSYNGLFEVTGWMLASAVLDSKHFSMLYNKLGGSLTWESLQTRGRLVANSNHFNDFPTTLWCLAKTGNALVWRSLYQRFKSNITVDILTDKCNSEHGQSMLWNLSKSTALLLEIFDDFKSRLSVDDLRNCPASGLYKNHTVLSNTCEDFVLFKRIIQAFHQELTWEDFQAGYYTQDDTVLEHLILEKPDLVKVLFQYCSFTRVQLTEMAQHPNLKAGLRTFIEARIAWAKILEASDFNFTNEELFRLAKGAHDKGYLYAFNQLGDLFEDCGLIEFALKAYKHVTSECPNYDLIQIKSAEHAFMLAMDEDKVKQISFIKKFFKFSLNIENSEKRDVNLHKAAALYYRWLSDRPLFVQNTHEVILSKHVLSVFNNVTDKTWCWSMFDEQVRHYQTEQDLSVKLNAMTLKCETLEHKVHDLEEKQNTLLCAFGQNAPSIRFSDTMHDQEDQSELRREMLHQVV